MTEIFNGITLKQKGLYSVNELPSSMQKGDLIVTSSNSVSSRFSDRFPIGSSGQILISSPTNNSKGLLWANVSNAIGTYSQTKFSRVSTTPTFTTFFPNGWADITNTSLVISAGQPVRNYLCNYYFNVFRTNGGTINGYFRMLKNSSVIDNASLVLGLGNTYQQGNINFFVSASGGDIIKAQWTRANGVGGGGRTLTSSTRSLTVYGTK